ncbi:hypothetical protein [Sinorhizobium fredii]|uniref:Uncharacterized protein n=1 Tax=Rhizobium fredii TaxID=380 RepID=A0A2L0H8M3_RHIFR|nr:hypothetical protein [Sinorhizobium fredii]AUX77823.1 hypothetical protein NXT3_CH03281 [Sinorhizobium fredii]
MGSRRQERDEELRKRYHDHHEAQRQALLQMINSLPKEALPAEYNNASLSDQIEEWQVANGVIAKPERQGLSIGNRKALFDAGMQAISRDEYPEGTVWDLSGVPWMPGPLGTMIPARPNIKDRHDWAKAEKEDKEYTRHAERLYPLYRTVFPDDDPDTVAAAVGALTSHAGFSLSDLNAIAEDPTARYAAFAQIHSVAEKIAYDRQSGGGYDDDDDDMRTGGFFGGGSSGAGGNSGGGARAAKSDDRPTPVSDYVNEFQRKAGLKV